MNEQLQQTPDGEDAVYRVAAMDGATGARITDYTEIGEVRWPFGIHEDMMTALWDVTHLPSGYAVVKALTRRSARRLVQELRALPVDWQFTEPKGPAWEAAREGARHVYQRFKAMSQS